MRPGERHLAVHVEDHPLDYADFEGTIPAGEYGAGTVEIWDRGTYELLEEKKNGGLTVRLHGERLDGVWTLVPAKLDGNPEELAAPQEGRRGGREACGAAGSAALLADVVLVHGTAAEGRGLAVRAQVGRVSRDRDGLVRRGHVHEP